MTDWKALCKELVQQLDDALDFTVSSDTRQHMKSIAARARTALAQPEPAEPTAKELQYLLYYEFTTSTGFGENVDAIGFARDVLKRWGR
jgi:hypothetical protein